MVAACPTWEWASGDPSMARAHLPADKQFLVTRGVACRLRVDQLSESTVLSESKEFSDDWCVPDLVTTNTNLKEKSSGEKEKESLDAGGDDEYADFEDESLVREYVRVC